MQPRPCGETADQRQAARGEGGRSPCARGNRGLRPVCPERAPSSPVRAGNRVDTSSGRALRSVDPRGCGGTLCLLSVDPRACGALPDACSRLCRAFSSPRVVPADHSGVLEPYDVRVACLQQRAVQNVTWFWPSLAVQSAGPLADDPVEPHRFRFDEHQPRARVVPRPHVVRGRYRLAFPYQLQLVWSLGTRSFCTGRKRRRFATGGSFLLPPVRRRRRSPSLRGHLELSWPSAVQPRPVEVLVFLSATA